MATLPDRLRWTRLLLKGVRTRLLRLSARRAVLLMAALFLLLLAAGDGVLLWVQHEERKEEATQAAANLTIVLEKYVRQSLQHLDSVLLNTIFIGSDRKNPAASDSSFAFAFRRTVLVESLRIYGANGRLRSSAGPAGAEAQDWSRNEGFLHHRDSADGAPFVGRPFQEDGRWRYPYSRRIAGPGGSFQGVAAVLIDLDAFASFFRSINVGSHGSVAIIRRDGRVIARYPPVPGTTGFSVADSQLFKTQIVPLSEGMVSGASTIDGVVRIGHFRSVAGLPLVVVVFVDEADALAPWWRLVELHVGILGAVALAVLLLVALVSRQQANLARATAAVRDEQRRAEAITAHLPALLLQRVQDADGRVHYPYVSPGADAVLGMSREQFMANPQHLLDWIVPRDRTRLEASLQRSAETQTDLSEEFRVIRPGGDPRWLRASARPRRLESGALVWDGLIMDVTAHKAAMADKRALERRLEAIVNKVPGVVFQRVLDGEGRIRYTYISPAVESLFGVTPQEVMRDYSSIKARTVPEDLADLEESFNRQDNDHGEWSREFRVTGPDGQQRWVRGTASRHRAETGEVVWDGIFLDVTMQKAAVAATRALQRRVEAVVANTPGVVFECLQTDRGLRFSFLSPQFEQIFRLPIREALHDFNRIKADIVPEDRPLLDARLREHAEDLADWVEEFRIQPEGQPLRWIRGTARARRMDDGTVVWNGVFQDVTQSKSAEEQAQRAQRNEALAHLTAGVAHEFNNLLTVIQGNLELMEVGEGSAPDLIAATQRAAERGAQVTRALQAYSRRQSLRPRVGRFSEMLQEVMVLLHSILGQSIQLELRVSEDAWPIHVDWDQLGNTLIALAVKAKEAMNGGGTLRIEIANATLTETKGDIPLGDYVKLTVSDSGRGMPDAVRRHAFDPFYSATHVGGGADLGLSTVFGFVKQSLGHVALDSREGQGTTVSILLPRAGLPDNAAATAAASD